MTDYPARLTDLRAATAALLAGLVDEQWSQDDVAAPSLLPGWTRGHVLSHLARNADSISRTVAGALRGERVARYPGGPDGRAADIEAGAVRPAAEQLADVRESAERLDRIFGAVADVDGWDATADDRTVGEYVLGRWREVEIHRVDAGGGCGPADWSPSFVRYLLPEVAAGLGERTDDPVRVTVVGDGSIAPDLAGQSWAGRADAPGVDLAAPDHVLLAWLIGRAAALTTADRARFSTAAALRPWM